MLLSSNPNIVKTVCFEWISIDLKEFAFFSSIHFTFSSSIFQNFLLFTMRLYLSCLLLSIWIFETESFSPKNPVGASMVQARGYHRSPLILFSDDKDAGGDASESKKEREGFHFLVGSRSHSKKSLETMTISLYQKLQRQFMLNQQSLHRQLHQKTQLRLQSLSANKLNVPA